MVTFFPLLHIVAVNLYIVFPGDPPKKWKSIPGVRAVKADELGTIDGKFAVVVGDCHLAERLKVACLTEEEAEELLRELKAYTHSGR